MITSKQRAYLRKLANDLDPVMLIGKEGLTDNVLRAIDEALEKRELIKVKILESALLDSRMACDESAKELKAEPVQAIGSKFVLYRMAEKKENRKIDIKGIIKRK